MRVIATNGDRWAVVRDDFDPKTSSCALVDHTGAVTIVTSWQSALARGYWHDDLQVIPEGVTAVTTQPAVAARIAEHEAART